MSNQNNEENTIPAPLLKAIVRAFHEAYDLDPEKPISNNDFEKFRDGFLVAHAQVHDLVIKNGNLTQSFLMMMKDLRTYATWLMRSHLGGSIVNGNQFNQAKFMQETLDQIAESKKWDIIDQEATKL